MSPSTSPSIRRRRPLRAAALLLPLVLNSCFTMALWGFESEDEQDSFTGQTETTFVYDPRTEWSWKNFGLRVLLTPFALALDCLTCPLQACLCACDQEERHDGCGR